MTRRISVRTRGQGLHEITRPIQDAVEESGLDDGLCTILVQHTEGPDDMFLHIKAALTATTLSVPIVDGRLGLGTWQGIYLWEHRHRGSNRNCLVHVG
jgi:thiamine phosphate synthase YjbQ (UPF0047 family)